MSSTAQDQEPAMLRIDSRTDSFDDLVKIPAMSPADRRMERGIQIVMDDAAWKTPAEDAPRAEAARPQPVAATSTPIVRPGRLQPALKRVLDITLVLMLMPVYLPVLLILTLAVKLDSPGPVFYNRVRVGKDGTPFVMYKLRTMAADAEHRLADFQHLNRGGAHMIKIADDPRVTRLGRFLRASSLDEVPQLLNVLKGDMSIVGPRPQAPNEVALYTNEQRQRLAVTPGITGLWQIRDRHNPSFERWVSWDLTYIAHWSLLVDIRILLQTFAMVLADSINACGKALGPDL
jgi:lipopolysaccharide/colanic/teichoic acid biosynthesis glycosyltransferase